MGTTCYLYCDDHATNCHDNTPRSLLNADRTRYKHNNSRHRILNRIDDKTNSTKTRVEESSREENSV